jgi:hypothetical protein
VEYKNALKHEKIDWGAGPAREDLRKSGQTGVAATSPFVLLLLWIALHNSCLVLDGGGVVGEAVQPSAVSLPTWRQCERGVEHADIISLTFGDLLGQLPVSPLNFLWE